MYAVIRAGGKQYKVSPGDVGWTQQTDLHLAPLAGGGFVAIWSKDIPATSSSPSIWPPWKCGTSPQPARSSVDLPEPERPAITTNSPGSTRRSISRSASARAPGYR